jgi:hypothetical protein
MRDDGLKNPEHLGDGAHAVGSFALPSNSQGPVSGSVFGITFQRPLF